MTCYWGVLTLLIARGRGELGTVLEAIEGTEKALAELPERALSDALKSSALQNLGVAELWSSRFDDARRALGSRSLVSVTSESPVRGPA